MACPLLALPAELRNAIWEYALCTHDAHIQDAEMARMENHYREMHGSDFGDYSDDDDDDGDDDDDDYRPGDEFQNRFTEKVEPMYPPEDDDEETSGGAGEQEPASDGGSMTFEAWEQAMQRVRPKAPPLASPMSLSELYGDVDMWEDDEEETDDEEDGEADFSDDEFGELRRQMVDVPRPRRYRVTVATPFNLALLRVNRNIHTEATSIFYSSTRFILDADGATNIGFLLQLPRLAFESIEWIALPSNCLMSDDGPSHRAWSGDKKAPLTKDPTVFTTFGRVLASMPRLYIVDFYVPYSGREEEDWYCSWAPTELLTLLKHGRLEHLSMVFFGPQTKKALQSEQSTACAKSLLGDVDDYFLAQEFERMYPFPKKARQKPANAQIKQQWQAEKARSYRENKLLDAFHWYWDDRDLDMGHDGNVQAVLTFFAANEGKMVV